MTRLRNMTLLVAAVAIGLGVGLTKNGLAAEFNWKMATSWGGGPLMEIGAKAFAKKVKFLTDGRVDIQVFTGGQLGSALKVSETVRNGVAQVGHTWMGYDWGKDMTTVLFGGFAGLTKDICVKWHDFGRNDFYSHHYAVVGNNESRKYCALGFITFSRQNTWVNLKAGRGTIKFEHLKAICEFDGFPLTPGMEVESELLYVNCSDSPRKALEKYIDLILRQKIGRAHV